MDSATTTTEPAHPTPQRPPTPLAASSPTPTPLRGSPGVVGIPTVIAGAVGLGITNIGALPTGAVAATIAIVMSCTTIGLLITTVWAALLGLNAAASIYAIFFGFYASYAALVLGLTHHWFGATADGASVATLAWLICWLVTIGVLTVVTLRMPLAFTVLFVLVDIALALLIIGVLGGAAGATHAGGVVVFAFVALAVYLYADAMSTETGGKPLPMGRPIVNS
jgi:hypothetical protein